MGDISLLAYWTTNLLFWWKFQPLVWPKGDSLFGHKSGLIFPSFFSSSECKQGKVTHMLNFSDVYLLEDLVPTRESSPGTWAMDIPSWHYTTKHKTNKTHKTILIRRNTEYERKRGLRENEWSESKEHKTLV